ncbi:WD domain, G-beta repeat protein [Aspergillus ellipticus CBS 707.79]|uniref:WD domain, G-beta repeat protein n=1 Tax=Aspergillus ellipticus CBS 707.79 TaxID=1448320 RepID=A0A319DMQ7_9EURO|nr:WD domain, G-beta repeat protein [Aspergillus ellipticus CBS 707.79]
MVELSWSRSQAPDPRPPKMKPATPASQSQTSPARLEPCASTASLLLYAQGSTIICLHHDSLAVERRFESHQADIGFIYVDNISERGPGRLVVSYDVGQTAIVWDLFTGGVIARFASFEQLKVAAWMRNGNVAFGNEKGDVIIFEPSTSEHISCRTIFDPITALAPATDCRTYAIGYQNGSIMLATLHPTFTILHTMTTSRGPSAILSLAWHASSSKQKSDMLATLSANGDMRVWSVSKPPAKEVPRVIRVLKRSDGSPASEPKWMAWSRNGRIVQYLEGETWAWDVKTKHVTYEPIPTIDNPRGFANYGPTATLFTLGPQYTVQQYDVDNPAIVANVQHAPVGVLPAPLEQSRLRTLQDSPDMRESGAIFNTRRTPFDLNGVEAVRQQRADISSPASSRSHANSVSSKASSENYRMVPFSPPSRSGQTGTSFSLTSASGRETPQPSGASYAYASSVSMSSMKSSRAGSRLKNEVQLSPADNPIDLFPFTRARLNDVPYGHHPPLDESRLTPDDLRQQMLGVVFGFEGDIEELIKDELSNHPPTSQSAILLAQWLGGFDTDNMISMLSSGPASTTDWILLAFSQIALGSHTNTLGQAFVQKLLEIGDVHTAATILLGMGDRNDAIEVYVSQNYYMEAILMTCLVLPTEWRRQSYLVRRWGEHVVSHSQQQLAIRCFMCTGVEPSEPWTSPAAQQATSFAEVMTGRLPMTSPEPPYPNPANLMVPNSQPKAANNARQSAKTPALKLITSFDSQPSQKFKFPGLKSDDRTPTNAPGVTPIAESAVAESAMSPGGLGSYKLNNIQSINNAMNARTNTPGFSRRRLPSIGETPIDVHPPTFSSTVFKQPLVDYGSTSENDDNQAPEQDDEEQNSEQDDKHLGLLSSARYEPDEYKPSPQTAVQAKSDKFATIKGLPSPAAGIFEALKERSDGINGTNHRKPDGLQLDLHRENTSQSDMQDQSDTMANFRSPASTLNSFSSARSPSVSGRSIDPYISSLGEANYHAKKYQAPRSNGRARRNTGDSVSQTSTRRYRSRNPSQETRGRNENRYIPPAKRSPASPVPMTAEELARINANAANKPSSRTQSASRVRKPRSRNSSERRQNRSGSRATANHLGEDRNDIFSRGRSMDRQGSSVRSPSSPLPASNADDALRLVTSDRERLRTRQRSSSRRPDKGAKTDISSDTKWARARSRSRQDPERRAGAEQDAIDVIPNGDYHDNIFLDDAPLLTKNMLAEASRNEHSVTIPQISLAEQKRKELAAAELEARRLSLARNPSAPNIPFPGELQPTRMALESPPFSVNTFAPRTPARNRVATNKGSPECPSSSDSNSSKSGVPLGLPATPKAKRNPKHNGYEEVPSVPAVPDSNALLSDARYQGDAERIGRSMSVPVPESHQPGPMPTDLPMHPRFNPHLPRSRSTSRTRSMAHRRDSGGYSYGGSPVTVSIEETIENAMPTQQVENPPILPELQHLSPPPPPPPPAAPLASPRESSGTIDIAIDNEDFGRLLPRAMTAAPTTHMDGRPGLERRRMSFEHRRGRSVNESLSTRIRNLTRMGSTKGPDTWVSPDIPLPYESVQIFEGRF